MKCIVHTVFIVVSKSGNKNTLMVKKVTKHDTVLVLVLTII